MAYHPWMVDLYMVGTLPANTKYSINRLSAPAKYVEEGLRNGTKDPLAACHHGTPVSDAGYRVSLYKNRPRENRFSRRRNMWFNFGRRARFVKS
jgi:hypothetical protein